MARKKGNEIPISEVENDTEQIKDDDEQVAQMEANAKEILENAVAKAEEIVGNAVEKAQEIVENAKKEAASMQGTTSANGSVDDETAAMNEKMEEYVTIKLFKDNGRYQDDVFVAVNGEGCSIPRGIPVRVKKKFVAVLDQSDLQDMQTVRMMDEESRKFDEESKRYGM